MHPYIAIPAVVALVLRAWSNKSLTPAGIAVATSTAVVHAIHPWNVFFALLVVFFLGGTAVTKVKHDVKGRLTLTSTGLSGSEGPRTHVQVLANSIVASVLILLHRRQLHLEEKSIGRRPTCWPYGQDLLVVGIVCNYAAVAADTFSSELGILSKGNPRLLTSWNLRKVPPGTNGGVTLAGILAGFLGALTIALTSVILLPFCTPHLAARIFGDYVSDYIGQSGWRWQEKCLWVIAVTLWGGLGSLLDSFLGGWLQASVVDVRTGKVIEGSGGKKVPINSPHSRKDGKPSRKIESGLGLLDNNAVNLTMALIMSISGMVAASYAWNLPIQTLLYSFGYLKPRL